jgi:hypothetical protein
MHVNNLRFPNIKSIYEVYLNYIVAIIQFKVCYLYQAMLHWEHYVQKWGKVVIFKRNQTEINDFKRHI